MKDRLCDWGTHGGWGSTAMGRQGAMWTRGTEVTDSTGFADGLGSGVEAGSRKHPKFPPEQLAEQSCMSQ